MKSAGISACKYILGRGCKRTKKGNTEKDRYTLTTRKYNSDVKFVIQYCYDIKQFIAWKTPLKPIGKQTIFSVIADEIQTIDDDKVRSLKKGKEFAWNKEIDVLYFGINGMDAFINVFKKSI